MCLLSEMVTAGRVPQHATWPRLTKFGERFFTHDAGSAVWFENTLLGCIYSRGPVSFAETWHWNTTKRFFFAKKGCFERNNFLHNDLQVKSNVTVIYLYIFLSHSLFSSCFRFYSKCKNWILTVNWTTRLYSAAFIYELLRIGPGHRTSSQAYAVANNSPPAKKRKYMLCVAPPYMQRVLLYCECRERERESTSARRV